VRGQFINRLRVLPHVAEFGNAEGPFAILFRRENSNQPFRILCRDTAKKWRVNNAKYSHICGNPEGGCQNREESKPWILSKHAQTAAQIL